MNESLEAHAAPAQSERRADLERAGELLRVEGLCKYFPVVQGVFGRTVGHVKAVDDVSFELRRGETLGVVGESGCGKTTAGRSILRLIEPTAGRIWFEGTELTALPELELRRYRPRMQIIFQDPFGSLNPRLRVLDIVGEAVERHGLASGAGVEAHVKKLLARVGVPASWVNRYPHEFSGGQRQRIGIARAIALEPRLIVCDEAVSALDVSIRAQVINLLIDLRREMDLAYLFIAHDLSVVRHISDRVAVMYLGRIVELADSHALFERPAHPYTRALLSAVPIPDPRRRSRRLILQGDVPTPLNPPRGCHFHTRCPMAMPRCSEEAPPLFQLPGGRTSRCFHAEGLAAASDWFEQLEARFAETLHESAVSERRVLHPEAVAPAPEGDATEQSKALQRGVVEAVAAQIASAADAEPTEAPGGRRLAARPRLFWPVALQTAGAVLVVIGSWGLGALVAALGYLRVRRALGGEAARRRGLDLAFVALLVVAGVLSRTVEPIRDAAATRRRMYQLAEQIEAYTKNTGALPEALTDLRWRSLEVFGRAEARDAWDRPFGYAPIAEPAGFVLTSLGRDGVPSEDDLSQRFERGIP